MNRRRLVVGGAVGLVAVAVWATVRVPLAEAMAAGLVAPWFETEVRTFGAAPLDVIDRGFWLTMLLGAIAVVLLARYRHPVRGLLLAPGDALDLAVARIVVFGVLALLPRVREAVSLSSVPAELRRPPAGVPWLLDVIPPDPTLVKVLAVTFVLACLASALGLFTRVSMVVAAVLGLYVLGVPQFYGKVSHYHHLLWIAAVLAAAPSGTALSIDAMRRAWRTQEQQPRPEPSVAYGFPVRVTWLLIAITYLFPGMWKFASAGLEWALSDNLRTVMYEHWTRLDGFVPILPVDQWPVAYQLGGLFTLAFELGFVFFLWRPRARAFAAATGLVFHTINYVFLRLGFVTLQLCYVVFVPWQRLAERVGARLTPGEVHVGDGGARRLLNAVSVLDPVARLRVHAAADGVVTRFKDKESTGWPAVMQAVRLVPLAWPLLPMLALLPDARRRSLLSADAPEISERAPTPVRSVRVVGVVGAILLLGNSYAGVVAATAAWPFASYPTFAGQAVLSPEILFVVRSSGGQPVEVTASDLRQAFTWEKLDGLSRPILNNEPGAESRARALLATATQRGVEVPSAGAVEVYASTPEWTPEGVRSAGKQRVLRFTR